MDIELGLQQMTHVGEHSIAIRAGCDHRVRRRAIRRSSAPSRQPSTKNCCSKASSCSPSRVEDSDTQLMATSEPVDRGVEDVDAPEFTKSPGPLHRSNHFAQSALSS